MGHDDLDRRPGAWDADPPAAAPAPPPGAGRPWPLSLLCGMAERKLSCAGLARSAGLSQASVRRYRRGRAPGPRNAARLRAYFGWRGEEVPPRVLLAGTIPQGYPTREDRQVMALLHAAARAAWGHVRPSRRCEGHGERMREHARRLAAEGGA